MSMAEQIESKSQLQVVINALPMLLFLVCMIGSLIYFIKNIYNFKVKDCSYCM